MREKMLQGKNRNPGVSAGKTAREKIVLEEIPINQRQKREVLQNIARVAEEKKYAYCPSFWDIFRGQLKYISRFCLGGQLLCLFLTVLLLGYFQWKEESVFTYLGTASAASSAMGIFLMMELNRSSAIGMMELEQTCYLNWKQVWCVKMILFGCLDILLLTVMVAVIAGNTSCGMFRVLVYLLVPFLLSNAVQLLVFTMLRGRKGEYLQAGAAAMCGMVSLIPLSSPKWYAKAYFGLWLFALAAAAACLIREISLVYRKMEEGEMVCWD